MTKWTAERPEEAEAVVATIPLGRICQREDGIGHEVAFLVGPESRYLTRATIALDGGQARGN